MPRKSRNEVAAGVFVLAGLAATLGVVLWLGSSKLFEKPAGLAVFYSDLADGSTGLREGNPLKVGGLTVGRIVELRLDAQKKRTLYVAQLGRADIRLHSNGTATVVAGLVGDSELAVTDTGDPNLPLSDETNPIKVVGGLSELMGSARQTLLYLEQTADSLRREMDANRPTSLLGNIKGELDANRGESLMAQIKDTMDHMHTIASTIVDVAANLRNETDPNRSASLMARVVAAAGGVNRIIADAEPKIGKTLTDVSETAGRIRQYVDANLGAVLVRVHEISGEVLKTAQNFAELSEKAKGLVDRNSPGLDEMVQNFVLVSANLKATAAEVLRSPWRLLYQPDKKELDSQNILDAARAFSSGAETLDEAVKGLSLIDPKTATPEDLKRIRDRLQGSFEKFTKAEQALLKELGKTQ